jgi:GR25 family glycosyltransferase involved in LPS biosynthesis
MNLKVISLKRSQARREQFITANPGLTFDFVDAVDGNLLTEAQLQDRALFSEHLPFPSAGAFGCALSHRALWMQAVSGQQVVTVVEDDAIFRADFALRAKHCIASLDPDWDLMMWGWNFDAMLAVQVLDGLSSLVISDQDALRQKLARFVASDGPVQGLRLDKCFGAVAYSISPKGAALFLDQCFPIRTEPVLMPGHLKGFPVTGLDIMMNRIYLQTKSYMCFPPLVVTENDLEISTIQVKPDPSKTTGEPAL